MIHAGVHREMPHMVDDDVDRQFLQRRRHVLELVRAVDEELDMPAEPFDPLRHRRDVVDRRAAAQQRGEAEAPEPDLVQPVELRIGDRRLDHRDAARTVAHSLNRVDRHVHHGAVAARMDDHRAFQPQRVLIGEKILER